MFSSRVLVYFLLLNLILMEISSAMRMPERRQGHRIVGSRRSLFVTTGLATSMTLSSPALALKEKNEALCGTGFFTNIWQYKCTDLGDISDEGVSKDMSIDESRATEALLSKFNLDSGGTESSVPSDTPGSSTEGTASTKTSQVGGTPVNEDR